MQILNFYHILNFSYKHENLLFDTLPLKNEARVKQILLGYNSPAHCEQGFLSYLS